MHEIKLNSNVILFSVIIITIVAIASALHIVKLDIPSPSIFGESVKLKCSYDLENEQLYSVKWYKNGYEFYRYVPRDWPAAQYFPMPGIKVDLSKSDNMSVYLKNINLSTSGKYRCEVSSEAPHLNSVAAEDYLVINVLPSEGPSITTGGKTIYSPGDMILVNCTSAKSKPAAYLNFTINDEPVGAEYDVEHITTLNTDGLETSILTLRFRAQEKHFLSGGNMRVKCTSTISRLYNMKNEVQLFIDNSGDKQQSSGLNISENSSQEFQQMILALTFLRLQYFGDMLSSIFQAYMDLWMKNAFHVIFQMSE